MLRCGLGRKWITGAVKGRESQSWRKAREVRAHRRTHKGNTSLKPLAGKNESG